MAAAPPIIQVSCGTTESQPNAPSPARTTPAPSGRDGAVTLTGTPRAVTTGLQAPWSVVFRDGTALVSERDARAAGKAADGVYVP
jgi:hypothetical protein